MLVDQAADRLNTVRNGGIGIQDVEPGGVGWVLVVRECRSRPVLRCEQREWNSDNALRGAILR
jgi:hypothetical protein